MNGTCQKTQMQVRQAGERGGPSPFSLPRSNTVAKLNLLDPAAILDRIARQRIHHVHLVLTQLLQGGPASQPDAHAPAGEGAR